MEARKVSTGQAFAPNKGYSRGGQIMNQFFILLLISCSMVLTNTEKANAFGFKKLFKKAHKAHAIGHLHHLAPAAAAAALKKEGLSKHGPKTCTIKSTYKPNVQSLIAESAKAAPFNPINIALISSQMRPENKTSQYRALSGDSCENVAKNHLKCPDKKGEGSYSVSINYSPPKLGGRRAFLLGKKVGATKKEVKLDCKDGEEVIKASVATQQPTPDPLPAVAPQRDIASEPMQGGAELVVPAELQAQPGNEVSTAVQ